MIGLTVGQPRMIRMPNANPQRSAPRFRTPGGVPKRLLVRLVRIASLASLALATAGPGGVARADDTHPVAPRVDIPAQTMLIGTWTDDMLRDPGTPLAGTSHSKGIYRVRLNTDGSLRIIDAVVTPNPSWLVLGKDSRFVYATNEDNGDVQGHVTALSRQADGSLALLNTVDSHGQQPTHGVLSPDGRFYLASNYSSRPEHAGVAVFPVTTDGRLGEMAQILPFRQGSGVNLERQTEAHAHSSTFAPDGRTVYVADLGADVIRAYAYDPAASPPFAHVPAGDLVMPPGSGPRHMLFDPSGRRVYITTEMGGQVLTYDYDAGRFTLLQRLDLTDQSGPGTRGGAGLVLSPDHRFLYVSNRRDVNQIVAYSVDPASGKLGLLGRYDAGGKEPRAMAIDASGNILLVTNVFSNSVVEFRRDTHTGALSRTGVVLQIGKPTDVKFVPGEAANGG
jgi:6-phosphogluconolactonase